MFQLTVTPDSLAALAAQLAPLLAAQMATTTPPPPDTSSGKMITVKETAKMLRRSEKSVRNYIDAGDLKAVDFNRGTALRSSYSIDVRDVEAFIKRRKR